jgi:hypothetical protein
MFASAANENKRRLGGKEITKHVFTVLLTYYTLSNSRRERENHMNCLGRTYSQARMDSADGTTFALLLQQHCCMS